jgi:hypothetical protein
MKKTEEHPFISLQITLLPTCVQEENEEKNTKFLHMHSLKSKTLTHIHAQKKNKNSKDDDDEC